MRRPASTRRALGILAISTVVFAAGAASAWSSPTTSTTSTTTTTATTTRPAPGADPGSPAALYFVLNGTVNAASDHEILGSSAFPNYTTGAVDNYYSKAHAHVDNAPFAEGTASPADTGPVGQTAAAGNFQQPQYADARWPGDPGKATYGTQGQPYAVASASAYTAAAEASEASSGLGAPGTPGGTSELAVPKGFDSRLRSALAAWDAKWLGRLTPQKPKAPPPAPTVTVPAPPVTVSTPTLTAATPSVTLGGLTTAPSVTVPSVTVPSVGAPAGITPKAAPSRSLQSSAAPADGATMLHSTSETFIDAKTGALVTTGESSLGRVSIGGGQIVLEGIHVSAKITNDGTPSDQEAVSVASASIGGIPVTIDQDGVHVAGKGQGLPYQQASDALNGALKAAGIQLFLVAPEIKRGSSDGQSGTTTTDTTTTDTTTTTSTDQTGTTSLGTGTCTPTSTSTTDTTTDMTTTTDTTTDMTTTTDTTTTTTTGPLPPLGSPGSGDASGMSPNEETVTATGVHVVFTQPVDLPGVPAQFAEHILGEVSLDSLAVPAGATPDFSLGLNLGLGSLGGLGGLGSSSGSGPCGVTSRRSGTKTKSAGLAKVGGGSTGGGSTLAGSSSASGSPSGFASGSAQPTSGVLSGSAVQPASSPVGNASPAARLVSMLLKKPLWLLLAYLVWQGLMLATGLSVWRWYRGEPS